MANKAKKNVSYRLLAVLLVAACVVLVVLPMKVLGSFQGYFVVGEFALYEVAQDIFDSGMKLWGVLPTFCDDSTYLGVAAALALYVFAATIVVAFVCAFIAIFTSKKAPALVRFATFVITWGAAAYSLCILCITSYSSVTKLTFDWLTTGIALGAAFFYFVLQIAHTGKAAWFNAIHFILSLAYTAGLMLAFTYEGGKVSAALGASKNIWKILVLVVVGLSLLNLGISSCRANSKTGLAGDPIRYIFQVIVALGAIYIYHAIKLESKPFLFFTICAIGVSLLQIVITLSQLGVRRKGAVKAAKANAMNDFELEETIEAVPYEGGPVAGVEVAELVNADEASATAEEAEEDYSGKFDAFIGTLSKSEREEFIDVYVLRTNGDMPEIPEYVVGGNNKAFFNKVFIYLGQYREKVSSELLGKIYDFSQKLS